MTDEELFRRYSEEFRALGNHPDVILQMSAVQAWCLFGQLQLALRHPENTGETARVARRIAMQIQEALAPSGALKEIAERGWKGE